MGNKVYWDWFTCESAVLLMAESVIDWKRANNKMCVSLYGVPRGGVPVALMLQNVLCKEEHSSIITDCAEKADVIVDDIVDSGRTKEKMARINPRALFVAMVDAKQQEEWIVFPWERGNEENGPEENIVRIMQFIGEDVTREGLVETPARVIRSYDKLFGGYHMKPEDVMKTFTEGACDNMVLLKNVEIYSTCEHHMLPFYGKCHIAYIPNGKVIGVSKLARLMEIYARRMQIQERIGQQITDALEKYLQPKGAACIIEAQHFCMTSRGVEKQNSVMVTSSLTGDFLTDRDTRNELMNLIRG